MPTIFDFIFGLYTIFYLPFLLAQGKWHGGFKVRFGAIPKDLKDRISGRKNIWLHAVSVGEVMAVDGLIRRLKEIYPDRQIVFSVSTKAGHALAVKKFEGAAIVIWSPLDFSFVVRRFVDVIQPQVYIAAETELWPNLFGELSRRKIPIVIVNGRISDRAFPRYCLIAPFLGALLEQVSLFCMQSKLDADRIVELGASRDAVRMVGNVKFDVRLPSDPARPEDSGFDPTDVIFVAGSTHPGEEEIMLEAYQKAAKTFRNLRLVIAPRHPERAKDIAAKVTQRGLVPVLYSKYDKTPFKGNYVLVVDTIGHLMNFYAIASLVFVGKSLTVGGGHNIIEPAVFAKPILTGPRTENFKDIIRVFREGNGVVQVRDKDELQAEVFRLLNSEKERQDLGRRARQIIQAHQGATQRTLNNLRAFLA